MYGLSTDLLPEELVLDCAVRLPQLGVSLINNNEGHVPRELAYFTLTNAEATLVRTSEMIKLHASIRHFQLDHMVRRVGDAVCIVVHFLKPRVLFYCQFDRPQYPVVICPVQAEKPGKDVNPAVFMCGFVMRLGQIGYVNETTKVGRAQDWVEYVSIRLIPLAVKVRRAAGVGNMIYVFL